MKLMVILTTSSFFILCLLLIGCSSFKASEQMKVVLNHAVDFKLGEDNTIISDNLIKTFSDYKVLLMGEIHYVQEHQVFMGQLMKQLHSSGFRFFLQETGSSESILVDYYIKGMMAELPLYILNKNKSLIESLYDFNKTLRIEGSVKDQISFLGFDMNHTNELYYSAISILSQVYDNSKLKVYSNNVKELTSLPSEYRKILTEFIKSIDDYSLTNEHVDILHLITQNELDSLEIRLNWNDNAREDYIENEVVRVIERSKEDDKLVVNCGSWHAQLIPHWTINNDKEFRWLGMRLKDYFEFKEGDFYSVSVSAYEGERKLNLYEKERETFQLNGNQPSINVLKHFKDKFRDNMVFLDYKLLNEKDGEILIEYPPRLVQMNPNLHFNGLLVYPKISVPEELSYFE